MSYGSYLVCKEYLDEVSEFLKQFFSQIDSEYAHSEWITFIIPGTNFLINLMKGEGQESTKNVTFEIYFCSLVELKKFADTYKVEICSFESTKAKTGYLYYYCEILGPNNICKIEASYTENL